MGFAGDPRLGNFVCAAADRVAFARAMRHKHPGTVSADIEAGDETIPLPVRQALAPLVVQLRNLDDAIVRPTDVRRSG
jgi:hypothetical protein